MIEVEDMIGIILIMIGRMIEVEAEMVTVDQMIDLEIMITVIEEDNDLSIFSKMTNRKHLSYYLIDSEASYSTPQMIRKYSQLP